VISFLAVTVYSGFDALVSSVGAVIDVLAIPRVVDFGVV